jgi:hypothetical protein
MMALIGSLAAGALAPRGEAAAPFAFRDAGPVSLALEEDGRPVYVYNHGPILQPGFPEEMSRSSYLHPVYAPDGTVLTDDFNPDHPHHRGISWMWEVVVVDGARYDLWTVKGIKSRFVRWAAREAGSGKARLAVENGWFIGDRKVVREDVEIVALPLRAGRRTLEFRLRFEAADGPVQIAGTPSDKKGFGGFCFRFAPRDGGREKTVIVTEQGPAARDGVNEPHRWAAVLGTFKGRPAGGRIEDDPANPGYPANGWLMRFGFGFLNVYFPGLRTHTLEPGKPLALRYRVTLFNGTSVPE